MPDKSEWGYVVENYKEFYRGKDYVTQMSALVEFTRNNPDEAYAHFLRGYHYKYLGYDKEAQTPLLRAVELESRDRLAAELLVMAGGKLPESLVPANPVPESGNPASTQKPSIPAEEKAIPQAQGSNAPSTEGSDAVSTDQPKAAAKSNAASASPKLNGPESEAGQPAVSVITPAQPETDPVAKAEPGKSGIGEKEAPAAPVKKDK
jgi:hypothetical protein